MLCNNKKAVNSFIKDTSNIFMKSPALDSKKILWKVTTLYISVKN